MKKFIVFLILTIVLFAGYTAAAPVSFDVSGEGSYVELTDNYDSGWLGWASINGELAPDLDSQIFTLNDNESRVIDFFNLTVTSEGWLAGGLYGINARLAFELPETFGVSDEGSGIYGSAFGVIQAGTLNWDIGTFQYTLLDGNIVEIEFEDGCAIGCGDSSAVQATITNLGGGGSSPVPEPATLILLGSGLIAITGFRSIFRTK